MSEQLSNVYLNWFYKVLSKDGKNSEAVLFTCQTLKNARECPTSARLVDTSMSNQEEADKKGCVGCEFEYNHQENSYGAISIWWYWHHLLFCRPKYFYNINSTKLFLASCKAVLRLRLVTGNNYASGVFWKGKIWTKLVKLLEN